MRLCIRLFKSFLSETGILHFKHHCTESLGLLPRASSPGSLQRTERNMSPLNTAAASPGGNGLNEASVVATGSLSANGKGEVGTGREPSRAQFRDFLHFFKKYAQNSLYHF